MKNINKLLLCITFVSTQFTLRTENLESQISAEAVQEAPIPTDTQPESNITRIDKAQTKPQDILNTINNVVNMVQTANNLVNQIVPTDNTTTKTTQQQTTTNQPGNLNIQNILDTTQNVLNIVQNANNFIDQILPIDGETGTSDQIVTNLSESEIEKWKYVNNYFQASIGNLNSYEKIGEFISQNAKFLAMPTVILYKFLAENVLTKLSSNTTNNTTDEPKDTKTTAKASSAKKSIKALGSGGIKYITAPIIGGLLTYRIIKFIGAKIGTKTTKCNTALINFAKDWSTHKEKTPDILWSLFEHLNKELVDNNGKMSQIDAALAQKIIEAIAINASIYEPITDLK